MSKSNIVSLSSDQPAKQESPNRLSFTLEEMLKEFENGAVPRSKYWRELITALYDTANHVVTGVTSVADVRPDNVGNIPLLPKDIDAPAMVRMDGADANTQQTNQDVFGRSLFYGDACKVVHQYGAYYEVLAGTAYVAGIRFFYPGMQELLIEEDDLPISFWLDIAWPSDAMEERQADLKIIISSEKNNDYIDNNDIQHYVEQITNINENREIKDVRSSSNSFVSLRKSQLEPVTHETLEQAINDNNSDRHVVRLLERGNAEFRRTINQDEYNSFPDKAKFTEIREGGEKWVLKFETFVDVKWFGAVGDGISDDTDAVIDAISLGVDVHFDGTYLITSPVYIRKSDVNIVGNNSIIIWNGVSDLNNRSLREIGVFSVHGSVAEDPFSPVNNIKFGNDFFDVSNASLFSIGQYIYLYGVTPGDNYRGCYPSIRTPCKVVRVEGNRIYIDYKFGWTIEDGIVSSYMHDPLKKVKIQDFIFNDIQTVTPSPDNQTRAPDEERNRAVCFATFRDTYDCYLKNVSSENTKLPVVLNRRSSDLEIKNVTCNHPIWFGPGEGYGVQSIASKRVFYKRIISTGGRHTVDFTQTHYSKAEDCHGYEPRQNDFITHGTFEHNITWLRCSGGSFRPSAAGYENYGNFSHNIKCYDCQWEDYAGYSLDVKFVNCQINTCITPRPGNLTLINTTIYNFQRVRKDGSSRLLPASPITGGVIYGDIHIDKGTKLIVSQDLDDDIAIRDFNNIFFDGRIQSNVDSGDNAYGTLLIDSGTFTSFNKSYFENIKIKLRFQHSTIQFNGCVFLQNKEGNGGASISTETIDRKFSDSYTKLDIINNSFILNQQDNSDGRTGKAFSLINNMETASRRIGITIKDNYIVRDNGSSVISSEDYEIVYFRNKDNRYYFPINSRTFITDDNVTYSKGDVQPKGTNNAPAMWDNENWIDLT